MMHNMILALILWINCSKVNQMVKFDLIRLRWFCLTRSIHTDYIGNQLSPRIYWLRGLQKNLLLPKFKRNKIRLINGIEAFSCFISLIQRKNLEWKFHFSNSVSRVVRSQYNYASPQSKFVLIQYDFCFCPPRSLI